MTRRFWAAALAAVALLALACAAPRPGDRNENVRSDQDTVRGWIAVEEPDGKGGWQYVPPGEDDVWPMDWVADAFDIHGEHGQGTELPLPNDANSIHLNGFPQRGTTYTNPWPFDFTWDHGGLDYAEIYGEIPRSVKGWRMRAWFERNGVVIESTVEINTLSTGPNPTKAHPHPGPPMDIVTYYHQGINH